MRQCQCLLQIYIIYKLIYIYPTFLFLHIQFNFMINCIRGISSHKRNLHFWNKLIVNFKGSNANKRQQIPYDAAAANLMIALVYFLEFEINNRIRYNCNSAIYRKLPLIQKCISVCLAQGLQYVVQSREIYTLKAPQ